MEVLAVSNPPAPEIPELFSAGMDKKVKKWELGTKFNPDAIYCNDECVCRTLEHSEHRGALVSALLQFTAMPDKNANRSNRASLSYAT